MRRGRALLAATAFVAGACAAGTSSATITASPTRAPTAAAQAIPPATGGIVLDTTRAADDIALVVSSPVRRGSTAVAQVTTAPSATCTITVTYASGPSTARGLEPTATDGAGRASWSWTIGANTTPGRWPVEVTCSLLSGQRTVARELLTVE